MILEVKRVNYWTNDGIVPKEKPETVELFVEEELIFSEESGLETDAKIEGLLLALDFLGKDYSYEVQDEFE